MTQMQSMCSVLSNGDLDFRMFVLAVDNVVEFVVADKLFFGGKEIPVSSRSSEVDVDASVKEVEEDGEAKEG